MTAYTSPCCQHTVDVHPQGATIGYAMLAALPEMNEKISVMLQLGPVVFVDFASAPSVKAAGYARAYEVGAASLDNDCWDSE